MGDGLASVSGGAIANASIVTGAAVETDRLAGMLNKPDGGEVTIELPSVLPVSASTLAGFEAQILMKRAERDFADGLSEEALQRVDAVLQITPDFALAHELRAQILATANRLPEAISETGWLKNHHSQMDEALIAESRILAVQLKGLASPEGTDSSDVDEVVAQYPNDEMVLMQAISAKMSSQDFEGATKILYRTWDLSPTNPLIKMMDTEIAVCKRLTKSAAHRRAVMYASLPIPVLAAYLQVAMGDDFEESKQILGKFDTGVLPSPPDAYFSEQLRFLISSRLTLAAMKGKTVDMEFVANSATKLIQDHPKWQSGYYLNLLYLSMKQAPNEQVMAVSRQMAEKTVGGDDPIFATYGDRVFGSQYVATLASTLFCLDSSIPTDQRRAWLQLAIDSAPTSSKPFLNAVAAESGVDFAVLIESDGRKGFSGTREELLNMLNRVTAMAADIKPDDPAFVLALVLGSGPLSSNMPCTLDFVETCSRALKQSRMSLPSALSNYGLMRSVAWLNGAEMVQSLALNARSAITQDEKAGLAELDNQYGANPPAMTIDRLRILLKNRLKVSLSDRAAMLMNEKDRIEQLATDQGDWIAAIVGIIRATKENGPPMSSFILNPLKNKFPGIEDTKEFKSMKQSLDTEEPKSQEVIKTLWQRIMAGISTLSDGTAIEQLVGLIISKNRMLPMPILNLLHECRSAIQARNKMGYLINPRPGK